MNFIMRVSMRGKREEKKYDANCMSFADFISNVFELSCGARKSLQKKFQILQKPYDIFFLFVQRIVHSKAANTKREKTNTGYKRGGAKY